MMWYDYIAAFLLADLISAGLFSFVLQPTLVAFFMFTVYAAGLLFFWEYYCSFAAFTRGQ